MKRQNKSKESRDFENIQKRLKMENLRRQRNNKDQTEAELSDGVLSQQKWNHKNYSQRKDPLLYSKCSELKVKKDSVKKNVKQERYWG